MANYPEYETSGDRWKDGIFGVVVGAIGLAVMGGGIYLGAEGLNGVVEHITGTETLLTVEQSLAALAGGIFIAYHAANFASFGFYNVTGSAIQNNREFAPTLFTKRLV